MEISYVICDSCGASVPEATGALVLPYGGRLKMHLCEKCFFECLGKHKDQVIVKVKGETGDDCCGMDGVNRPYTVAVESAG